ncbi:MAG: hypothetical protein ACON4Z_13015 [Planctomycetota bacterium]
MNLSPLIALAVSAVPAAAQCSWSSISVTSYGQGCSPLGGGAGLLLGASLDVTACRLDLDVTAAPGCCGGAFVGSVLALGFSPVSTPAPVLGPGCTLLASPGILIYATGAAASTFQLQFLAASLPPTTFYVQVASLSFSPTGPGPVWAASAGARLDLH